MTRVLVRARAIGSGPWRRWKYTCSRHASNAHDLSAEAIVLHLKARHRIGMADVLLEMEAARLRYAEKHR